jgi:hypothetical protein
MALINLQDIEKENKQRRHKKKVENANPAQYSLRVPRHIHFEFKKKILSNRTSMKEVLNAMILKYIGKEQNLV